jgi:hypothetical protein
MKKMTPVEITLLTPNRIIPNFHSVFGKTE